MKFRLLGIAVFILFSYLLWKVITEPDATVKNKIENKINSIPKVQELLPETLST